MTETLVLNSFKVQWTSLQVSVCSLQNMNMRAERKLASLHSRSTSGVNRTEVSAGLYTGCAASLTDSWWRESLETLIDHFCCLSSSLYSWSWVRRSCWEDQLCPDDPERLNQQQQLVCGAALTGPCYWEVEWRGELHPSVTDRITTSLNCSEISSSVRSNIISDDEICKYRVWVSSVYFCPSAASSHVSQLTTNRWCLTKSGASYFICVWWLI